MSVTYTPAPWRIEQPNESTPHIWITADGDNGGIAKLETCNYDDGLGERHTDQDRANARLIAAAPDLLSALEAIVNASWRERNLFLNAGRAAIARARGESA